MKNLNRLIYCTAFLVLLASIAVAEYPKRTLSEISSDELANRCFSRFIFGLSNNLPGIVLEEYQVGMPQMPGKDRDNIAKKLRDSISNLFSCFEHGDFNQLHITNKKVIIKDNEVVIKFKMTINLCIDSSPRRHRFEEELVLHKIGTKYVIVGAKVFPILLNGGFDGMQNNRLKDGRMP